MHFFVSRWMFPPSHEFMSPSEVGSVEYYRALAAILPFVIMAALIVLCVACAECCKRRDRKATDPPTTTGSRGSARDADTRVYQLPGGRIVREKLLRTPTGSVETPPSFDYMNYESELLRLGKSSVVSVQVVRPDLEGTHRGATQSPVHTDTPPFARLRPGLSRKSEDDEVGDESSRSPSPRTRVRRGKKMRYGACLPDPPPSASSTETTTTTTTESDRSTIFQMSFDGVEDKTPLTEAKERKKQLREKRRLKREEREERAEIVRQRVNRTAKDVRDQARRESRAIAIPPRKRVEEHPEFLKAVSEMLDEANAEFDAKTVLDSAWERGRMVAFLKKRGFVPPNRPGEAFSILKKRDPEPKGDGDARPGGAVQPGREAIAGAISKAAHDLSQYYKKNVVRVTESKDVSTRHLGARRKEPPTVRGAEGGEATTARPVLHGSERKKEVKTDQPDDPSQPLLQPGGKKRKVDGSQPLFHHYGSGRNYGTMVPEVRPLGVFTTGMRDSRVPRVHFEDEKPPDAKWVSAKIAKAVFNTEMKRIEDDLIQRHKIMKAREQQQHQVVVEVHPEPSTSGLTRRRRPSPPVVEEDATIVDMGDQDTSSSWEDVAPRQRHAWWARLGKKSPKKKKHDGKK